MCVLRSVKYSSDKKRYQSVTLTTPHSGVNIHNLRIPHKTYASKYQPID